MRDAPNLHSTNPFTDEGIPRHDANKLGKLFLDVPQELSVPHWHGGEEIVQRNGGPWSPCNCASFHFGAIVVVGEAGPCLRGGGVSCGDGHLGQGTQRGKCFAAEAKRLDAGKVFKLFQL